MKLQELVAGDTLDFVDQVAAYPATDGWTLKYRLVPRFATPTQAPIELFASTYEIVDYRVQAAPATTAAWASGVYTWARWVEMSGARQSLGVGELRVRANPAQAAQGYDQRSHARKVLEAIEAVLEKRATLDQEEYSINGRSLKRTPTAELLRLRRVYAGEVAAEDAAEGLAAGTYGGKKIQVRL